MSRCTECAHMLPTTRKVVCSVHCFTVRRKRMLKDQRDDERLRRAIAEVTRAELPTLPQLTIPREPGGPGAFYGVWRKR